jgi:hypothetical protein
MLGFLLKELVICLLLVQRLVEEVESLIIIGITILEIPFYQ